MRNFAKPGAFVSVLAAGFLSACGGPQTDLQGNRVSYYDAVADRFCQEEEGLQYGSAEYRSCQRYVSDYARTAVVFGSL